MATVRPFCAVRPAPRYAEGAAALPYDVMNSEEARAYVEGKPYSFMRIDRAEINFDRSKDPYSQDVYEEASRRLHSLVKEGVYVKDGKPAFYVYRQIMNGREQTGVVGCASVDDYINNVVKKHELTLAKKEDDRCNHVDFCNANTGPIFLTYRPDAAIKSVVEKVKTGEPLYDFTADGVRQTVWIADGDGDIETIESAFAKKDALYIADGHHRCASAVRVARKRRVQFPDYTGEEEFNFFLSVLFPSDELEIMDYNRVVSDLNGLSDGEFIERIKKDLDVSPLTGRPERIAERHTFGMYLSGKWYKLTAKPGTWDESDVISRLDVSILQDLILTPVLGIGDPRTDKRIDFVGGIRGLAVLEERCKTDMKVAFAMCPTSLSDLMSIADAGRIMPPKSTWFEPKLLSGLFIHELR
ncbi:MAG: DUF1015 domain-containing protein [Clostridia bacterium]|nr:DUF1015 domain-containing protein [Clostridia bacterium]